VFAATVMILISNSCKEKGGKNIDQGEIHYTIEYSGNTGSVPKDLMPKTLVVSFKKDKMLFEIISPFGNSGITNLVNPETKIFDTYISMFGQKYYYSGSPGETHPGFGSMNEMEIKKTSKTSNICGYNCKNAEVTFPFDRSKVYTIWYTNEIKVKNSNASTPYSELDGVLMSFYYIMGRSELKFDAETVYQKEIPDNTFERKPKFRLVSREDMDKLLTDLVNL
jgi:hypothetical protein